MYCGFVSWDYEGEVIGIGHVKDLAVVTECSFFDVAVVSQVY